MKQLLLFILIFTLVSCESDKKKSTSDDSREVKSTKEKKYVEIIYSTDTLFAVNEGHFEYGSSNGYANSSGDIIIPEGTFNMCFTDTFINFSYVFDQQKYGSEMVAVNRNKEVIFDAYLFDNGPDYISDGLFRIKRNGKIGFANQSGKIVIPPKYTCAFPFEDGKAKVAYTCTILKDDMGHSTSESDGWFYIDKFGKRIK